MLHRNQLISIKYTHGGLCTTGPGRELPFSTPKKQKKPRWIGNEKPKKTKKGSGAWLCGAGTVSLVADIFVGVSVTEKILFAKRC